MKNTNRRKTALLMACLMVLFTVLCSTQPVLAEDAVLTGTSGTITWQLDTITGRLTISGTGTLPDVAEMLGKEEIEGTYINGSIAVRYISERVKEVVIEDGITAMNKGAFANGVIGTSGFVCDGRWSSLTQITLPEGMTAIPGGAFYKCWKLQTVNLGQSIQSVGDYAFAQSGVTDVTIPQSVSYIGKSVFENCKSLAHVEIPESVDVQKEMFDGCESLYDAAGLLIVSNVLIDINANTESVTVPEGVKKIGTKLLDYGSEIKDLTFPEGLVMISDYAFMGSKLEKVSLPSTLQTIGEYAFSGCNMQEITIPEGIKSVGARAFASCTSLSRVTMPKKPEKVGYDIFTGCEALLDEHGMVVLQNTIYGKSSTWKDKQMFYIASDITDLAVTVPREADITLESGNTSFVLQDGNLYTADYGTLWHATPVLSSDKTQQTFRVANNCTKIANNAISAGGYIFDDADGYTDYERFVEGVVTIPPTVTCIEEKNLVSKIEGLTDSYAAQYASYYDIPFESIEMYGNMPADADNDGQVTLADAQLVLKGALKLVKVSAALQSAADMDNDGIITLGDAQTILKGALKLVALPEREKLSVDKISYTEFGKKDTSGNVPIDADWSPSRSFGELHTGDMLTDYRIWMLVMAGAAGAMVVCRRRRNRHFASNT